MSDLFGFEEPPKRRANSRKEAAALVEVMQALRHHPVVAWCERQNTGAAKVGKRFVRFGWKGCADVLGQLRDGRILAVEVKAPRGRVRPEQQEFLLLVQRFGGTAFVARNAVDVSRVLNQLEGNRR